MKRLCALSDLVDVGNFYLKRNGFIFFQIRRAITFVCETPKINSVSQLFFQENGVSALQCICTYM